jgi:uncharacterized protein
MGMGAAVSRLTSEVLLQIKQRLQHAFHDRLAGVILYGSEARQEADSESDIDLLVLLSGVLDEREDSWTCIRALYPVVLQLERPIHAKPTDIRAYRARELPLYRNASDEGIAV